MPPGERVPTSVATASRTATATVTPTASTSAEMPTLECGCAGGPDARRVEAAPGGCDTFNAPAGWRRSASC